MPKSEYRQSRKCAHCLKPLGEPVRFDAPLSKEWPVPMEMPLGPNGTLGWVHRSYPDCAA